MSFNEFPSHPKRHIPTDAIIVLGATLSVFLLGGILHLLSGGVRAQQEPAPTTMTEEESVVVESVTPTLSTQPPVETRIEETRIITPVTPLTQEPPRAVGTPPATMDNQPFVASPPPVSQQPPVVTEQPSARPSSPAPMGEAPAVTTSPAPMGETPAVTTSPAPMGEAPDMMGETPDMMGQTPDMMGETPDMMAETPDMMGETPTPTAAPQEIADPARIETLNQGLYEQLDSGWNTYPTFTQELTYRVQLNEQGEIVSYEPADPVAQQYTDELPLPDLSETPAAGITPAQPLANFRVVFTPAGVIQVTPWQNDIPQ